MLLVGQTCLAEGLDAMLERNQVVLGETLRLVLETDHSVGRTVPDLGPLEADFEVLSTSQSTQVQIAAGVQTVTTRWIVELLPRRSGQLVVPAISAATLRSRPLTLTVTPANSANTHDPPEIFLEAEVDPGPHYVQAQLVYRVRLYASVPILGGAISEPEADQTTVQRLGDDVSFTSTRSGRRYDVIERRYALFPQADGRLEIGGTGFSGQVADSGRGLSAMDRMLHRGRRLRVFAPVVEVEVRPVQPGFTAADWLPARDLRLRERWHEGSDSLTVGQPVTRSVWLEATGLPPSRLPILSEPVLNGVRIYPDRPGTESGLDGDWVTGMLEQRLALMPLEPGLVTLPAITVRWWDLLSDREREAVLPARTLRVLPAADGTVEATQPGGGAGAEAPALSAAPTAGSGWPWPFASAALLLLWLLTLAAWYRAVRGQMAPTRQAGAGVEPPSLRAACAELISACDCDDAPAARHALLAFGRARWPRDPPRGLKEIALRLGDDDLLPVLAELDATLYAPVSMSWSGETLAGFARAGFPGRRVIASGACTSTLPSLYPATARASGRQAGVAD